MPGIGYEILRPQARSSISSARTSEYDREWNNSMKLIRRACVYRCFASKNNDRQRLLDFVVDV